MAMNLDRRNFLGLAGLGVGAAALAACGGPSTSGSAASSSPSDIDFTGVKPAGSFDFLDQPPRQSQAVEQSIIDKFQAKFPDIKVNLVTAGANYEEIAQKFQTSQAAKSALPGLVVLSDVWWFRYYTNGNIIPLDGLIKQLDVNIDDFQKSLVADYQVRQQAVGAPLRPLHAALLLQQGPLQGRRPSGPGTQDMAGIRRVGAQAPGQLGRQVRLHLPGPCRIRRLDPAEQPVGLGRQLVQRWTFNCDSTESVAALQWAQDSIYKDKWAGVSSKNAADDFSAGITSTTISSTGDLLGVLKSAKFNVGVGFLPGGPKAETNVCPTGGAGLGIPSGVSKEVQLAAATFLKFMTEPENTAAFSAATGYMPTRVSADMTAVLAKTPQIKTAMDQLAVTKVQDNARVFLPGADQEMAKAAAKILTQQGDVKATMTDLKATLDGIYTKDVKPKLKS